MNDIDLRSDTVTQPTDEMRQAMATAIVGDDVFQDDPTIKSLEKLAAEMLGKEDALFVTSGTQGNAVSLMAHTHKGESVIMDKNCHIAHHELGGYGLLAGLNMIPSDSKDGFFDPLSIPKYYSDGVDIMSIKTGLVCVENAFSNGTVMPVETMKTIYTLAKDRGVPVHMDGARIFNAATALGVPVKELTQYGDTVMCCLSKGLCAPVGSVVAGSRDFIKKARKYRKMLGGGLRQSGCLAACGIIALTQMTQRLEQDHDNAKYLANQLAKIKGVTVDLASVEIDMIFFTTTWNDELTKNYEAEMLARGIKATPLEEGEYRMVTHKDITREHCEKVIRALEEIVNQYMG